jgi:hypothetical protein
MALPTLNRILLVVVPNQDSLESYYGTTKSDISCQTEWAQATKESPSIAYVSEELSISITEQDFRLIPEI